MIKNGWYCCPCCNKKLFRIGKETIVHKLSYRCKICRCNFEVNIGEPRANEPRAN